MPLAIPNNRENQKRNYNHRHFNPKHVLYHGFMMNKPIPKEKQCCARSCATLWNGNESRCAEYPNHSRTSQSPPCAIPNLAAKPPADDGGNNDNGQNHDKQQWYVHNHITSSNERELRDPGAPAGG